MSLPPLNKTVRSILNSPQLWKDKSKSSSTAAISEKQAAFMLPSAVPERVLA